MPLARLLEESELRPGRIMMMMIVASGLRPARDGIGAPLVPAGSSGIFFISFAFACANLHVRACCACPLARQRDDARYLQLCASASAAARRPLPFLAAGATEVCALGRRRCVAVHECCFAANALDPGECAPHK